MTRLTSLLGLAAVSFVLTPVVVSATGAPPATPAAPAPAQVTAAATVAAPVAAPVATATTCGKHVKVIYAGYGEAKRAGCVSVSSSAQAER